MTDPTRDTSPSASTPTEPPPPETGALPEAKPDTKLDKLAPFRDLMGMPVAVQFVGAAPYLQIAPMQDDNGVVQVVRVPETGRIIGLPSMAQNREGPTAVAMGVLRASPDGTWLIIEENLRIPRTGETPQGRALMDVYVRPEMVTHVSFVKAVEFGR